MIFYNQSRMFCPLPYIGIFLPFKALIITTGINFQEIGTARNYLNNYLLE